MSKSLHQALVVVLYVVAALAVYAVGVCTGVYTGIHLWQDQHCILAVAQFMLCHA